jgi:hypothetical protein
MKELKMAGTTHTTIRRHIIEDQNLQQQNCEDITSSASSSSSSSSSSFSSMD